MTFSSFFSRYILRFFLAFISYLAFAKLGNVIALPPDQASVVWPAAGVALGVLYAYGIRYFPAVLLAATINSLGHYDSVNQENLTISLMIASGATLQAICGQIALKRLYAVNAPLGSLKKIASFFFLIGPLPCVISAFVSSLALNYSGVIEAEAFWRHFISWYIGDLFGILLLTPVVIITLQKVLQGIHVSLKRRMTIVIPVVVSFCVFVLLFAGLKQQAIERSYANFYGKSEDQINYLKEVITLDIAAVKSVAAYLSASQYVSAQEFKIFTDAALDNTIGLYGLSHLPKVEHRSREAFVNAIKEQGFPDFEIKVRSKSGDLEVAPEHDFYFPIALTEPYKKNKSAHGFDVYGEDKYLDSNVRREVLDEARDTGKALATERLSIVQKNDQYGFIIYYPLYSQSSQKTIKDRRQNHTGYINGIFTLPSLFEGLASKSKRVLYDFVVYDVTNGQKQFLYDSRTPDSKEGIEESYKFSEDLSISKNINLAGREWKVILLNHVGVLSPSQAENLKIFLLIGMFLNMLLLVLLIVIVSRSEYAESLADAKTDDLKKQRDLLRAAEVEAKIGHWSYEIKTEKIFWSEQTYRIHEADPETFTPEIETAINFYHPHDRKRVAKLIEQGVESKKPFKFQARLITLKNKEIDVVSTSRAQLDKDGNVVSLFGTFQDVSEIISVQKKLIEIQEHYRLATEGANVGLWDWNVLTGSVYFNEQWYTMLGYQPYELPEAFETFESLCHPDDLEETLNSLNRHMKDQAEQYKIAIRLKHKDGSWVWIMASGQVVERDQHGKAKRVSGIHVDISDRKKIETELLEANAELEEFAYRTSHDLRSPLVSSLGLLDIITEAVQNDNQKEALESSAHIKSSIKKILSLIEDLLVLAETKNSDEEDQEIDINLAIQNAIEKLKNMDGFQKIKLEKSLKYQKKIVTKKMRFNLILENLISNAIKYYDPNEKAPYIKISTKQEKKGFVLEVEDNGLGIPDEMQKNLFKMFKRFHPRVSFGSGLGLYMVKKSVDVIGGEIEFVNTKHGSLFRVLIKS